MILGVFQWSFLPENVDICAKGRKSNNYWSRLITFFPYSLYFLNIFLFFNYELQHIVLQVMVGCLALFNTEENYVSLPCLFFHKLNSIFYFSCSVFSSKIWCFSSKIVNFSFNLLVVFSVTCSVTLSPLFWISIFWTFSSFWIFCT